MNVKNSVPTNRACGETLRFFRFRVDGKKGRNKDTELVVQCAPTVAAIAVAVLVAVAGAVTLTYVEIIYEEDESDSAAGTFLDEKLPSIIQQC